MSKDADAGYWIQLDALRAIAVSGVMLHHFWFATQGLDLGPRGVRLFFVLSGFLITGILLNARNLVEAGLQNRTFALRQFYLRRILRIFPLFYLVLAITWLIGLPEVRQGIFWHLSYLSNFYFATLGQWQGATAHLWSLAVEEQFYLFWPTLILFLPHRWLLPIILLMIALGPLFRLWALLIDLNWVASCTVTLASLDSLGMGALLAYYSKRCAVDPHWREYLTAAGLYAALPLNIGLLVFELPATCRPWKIALGDLLWALFCAWLVDGAKRGFRGCIGAFFEAYPVIYLGKISYGVYVYHLFMLALVPVLFTLLGLELPAQQSPASFVLLATSSVLIALLSWFCFEKPINKLKRLVPYNTVHRNYASQDGESGLSAAKPTIQNTTFPAC